MSADTTLWLRKLGLKLGHLNVYHILGKLPEVTHILNENNFHVFGFSESRLNGNIANDEVRIPGYNLIRRDALKKFEVGIVVYVSSLLLLIYRNYLEMIGIECVWLEIKLPKIAPILIGYLYRNPNEGSDWFDAFTCMIDNVFLDEKEIIILGDFNIDSLKPNCSWDDILISYNFTQTVNHPTRITSTSSTLIDHIYASCPRNIIETVIPSFAVSDQYPICCTWSKKGCKVPKNRHESIKYRCFRKFKLEDFLLDLQSSPLDNVYHYTDPDDAVNYWVNTFKIVYDKHVPVKEVRVKQTQKCPWITLKVLKCIKKRDKAHENKDSQNYRKLRNKVKYLIRKEKKKYFNTLVHDKSKCKDIWKAISILTNKNKEPISNSSGSFLSSDKFSNHFNSEINILKSSIPKVDFDYVTLFKYYGDKCLFHNSHYIPLLTRTDVHYYIRSLKNKNSSGVDEISNKILRFATTIICNSLTYIYNLCITNQYFPAALKIAKVYPLLKSGSSCNDDLNNYRPISMLSSLSKPLEKHKYKYTLEHLTRNQLLIDCQSGFRKNHSCHTSKAIW